MKKLFKKLLASLKLLIVAILLGSIVLPIGFLYDLGHSAYKSKFTQFLFRVLLMFRELFIVIISIFLVIIERIFYSLAYGIDQIGNVISGELIEDCITWEEDTTFGKSGVTISASTGKLEYEGKLNKVGKWFTKQLSKSFEENHSINAYKSWLENK